MVLSDFITTSSPLSTINSSQRQSIESQSRVELKPEKATWPLKLFVSSYTSIYATMSSAMARTAAKYSHNFRDLMGELYLPTMVASFVTSARCRSGWYSWSRDPISDAISDLYYITRSREFTSLKVCMFSHRLWHFWSNVLQILSPVKWGEDTQNCRF